MDTARSTEVESGACVARIHGIGGMVLEKKRRKRSCVWNLSREFTEDCRGSAASDSEQLESE